MTVQVMGLGPTELFIILGIIILLFGAAKLPELARGSGRALRIFKSETKGLMDEDDDNKDATDDKTPEQRELEARPTETRTDPVVREQRDNTTN
ncbi:MAG: Sec-independent protein translocase subunit TatA [Nocardioides sp.]